MGSWNGTCGISQLPILSGTKVKAFLMLQSEYVKGIIGGAGVCHSTAYFRPWFFPVDAEYNDYGSVENIQKDWNSDYMLATFQQWLTEGKVRILKQGEAEVNDPGISKFETLDDVFKCVERGALVFKTTIERWNEDKNWIPTPTELKIGMFLVLDSIFEGIIVETLRFENLKENSYHIERDEEWLNKGIEAIKRARTLTTKPTEFDSALSDIYVDRFLGDLIEEDFVFKHYKSILYAPDKVSIEDFFVKLDAAQDISFAMTFLRKLWIPQAGQGSQSEELSFNKALIGAMENHIKSREIEMEKQRIEDEEWEKKYKAKQAAKKSNVKKKKKT